MGRRFVLVIQLEGLETINNIYKKPIVNPYKVKLVDFKLDILLKKFQKY